MMRLFGALGVLDALGTIAVPILVRMSRPRWLKHHVQLGSGCTRGGNAGSDGDSAGANLWQ